MMTFTEHTAPNGVVYLTAPNLAARHAFTTRFSGVSTGCLSSLNLGTGRGDEEENVRENYRRLAEATGINTAHMAFTHQVHGNTVRTVTDADAHVLYTDVPYAADGLVTNTPGLALICFTADCVPVLLCDGKNGVVGAVHCGWRSSVADILGHAVAAMKALGAEEESLCAAIGPAIGGCCFEVGEEVTAAAERLLGTLPDELVTPREQPGKFLLDLKGVNRRRLLQLGLREESICVSDACTMCQSERFWSHRKTRGARGAQGALIVLEERMRT